MGFKIGSGGGGGDFEKPAVGAHIAVLADVVDIGVQKTPYLIENGANKGQPKTINQCILFWELNARAKEGEFAGHRFIKTQKVTASLYGGWNQGSPAKLFGIVTCLNGGVELTEEQVDAEYDISLVIGKSAMVYLADTDDGKYRFVTRVEALQDLGNAIKVEESYGPENYRDWIKDLIAARLDSPSGLPNPLEDDDISF